MTTIDACVIQHAKQRGFLPIASYQDTRTPHVLEWISPRVKVELAPDVHIALGDLAIDKELARKLMGAPVFEKLVGKIHGVLSEWKFGDQNASEKIHKQLLDVIRGTNARLRADNVIDVAGHQVSVGSGFPLGQTDPYHDYLASIMSSGRKLQKLDNGTYFDDFQLEMLRILRRMNWGILLLQQPEKEQPAYHNIVLHVADASKATLMSGMTDRNSGEDLIRGGSSSHGVLRRLDLEERIQKLFDDGTKFWDAMDYIHAHNGDWFLASGDMLLGVAGMKKLFAWHAPGHRIGIAGEDPSTDWSRTELYTNVLEEIGRHGEGLRDDGVDSLGHLIPIYGSRMTVDLGCNGGILASMGPGVKMSVNDAELVQFNGAALVLPRTRLRFSLDSSLQVSVALFSFHPEAKGVNCINKPW